MRTLIILLFVSFNSFGQIQYKDVMRIDSRDAFTRLMIDRGFSSVEYEVANENTLTYMLNPSKDDEDKWISSHIAQWWGATDNFFFSLSRTGTTTNTYSGVKTNVGVIENNYDQIYQRVKRRNHFYKMFTMKKSTWECYVCNKAKFEGYLCFTINDGNGQIAQLRYID